MSYENTPIKKKYLVKKIKLFTNYVKETKHVTRQQLTSANIVCYAFLMYYVLYWDPQLLLPWQQLFLARALKIKENLIAIILTDIAIIVNRDMFTIFAEIEIIIMRI